MAEHNKMLAGFYKWYCAEKKNRGYCAGNWKWIIPPYNSSFTPAYMKLNKMIEYTLKPALVPNPTWKVYREESLLKGLVTVQKLKKNMGQAMKRNILARVESKV